MNDLTYTTLPSTVEDADRKKFGDETHTQKKLQSSRSIFVSQPFPGARARAGATWEATGAAGAA